MENAPVNDGSQDGAQADAPAPVTKNELEALQSKLNNDFKAQLGRLQKEMTEALSSLKPASKPEPDSDASDSSTRNSPTLSQQVKALQEEIAKAKGKEERLKSAAARSALRDALVKGGADADLADVAIDSILTKYGKHVQVSENDLGGYSVQVDEGAGASSVADWVGLYLQTDIGKKLMPPKRVPDARLPGGSAPSGDVIRVTRAQMAKMDAKTLRSGRVEVTD